MLDVDETDFIKRIIEFERPTAIIVRIFKVVSFRIKITLFHKSLFSHAMR